MENELLSSPSADWSLHPRLAQDCSTIGDLPLSRLLASNDANYPWLLLVPRRADVSEIIDLDSPDLMQLTTEIARTAEALKAVTAVTSSTSPPSATWCRSYTCTWSPDRATIRPGPIRFGAGYRQNLTTKPDSPNSLRPFAMKSALADTAGLTA